MVGVRLSLRGQFVERRPWGREAEAESNWVVGRSEVRERRGKDGGGDAGSWEVREERFKP